MPPRKSKTAELVICDDPVKTNPYWQSECGRAVVYLGDNLLVLASIPDNTFHAVVTDPPYGLEFMGKEWDAPWKEDKSNLRAAQHRVDELDDPVKAKYLRHNVTYDNSDPLKFQMWFMDRARAFLRVSRPGAHLLSFGGSRMWHRMAAAIEDAGYEIRDTIMWVYSTGFPKGHNVGLGIDNYLGAERSEVLGKGNAALAQGNFNARSVGNGGYGFSEEYDLLAPVTEAAKFWDGWNTALKPAHEPIVMARKRVEGSVAQSVMKYGTGGINVAECRIGGTGETVTKFVQSKTSSGSGVYKFNDAPRGVETTNGDFLKEEKDGKYPANLIHDGSPDVIEQLGDKAARMFHTAKASASDRPHSNDTTKHPTVKPIDLMTYLVRLVCPQGGTVLDPFMGSGSTGCAAIQSGMRFVGIEQSEEYADIAVGRLKLALIGKTTPDEPGDMLPRASNNPPARARFF